MVSTMARTRTHDLDQLMDAAEALAVESGPTAVTVRALSEATSVSNGAIYHAFGSRAGLMGHVWLRAARRFLDLQRDAVDRALATGSAPQNAVEAVVAAADAPAEYSIRYPVSGHFLLAVRRADVLGSGDVPSDVASQLNALDDALTILVIWRWLRATRRNEWLALWYAWSPLVILEVEDLSIEFGGVRAVRDCSFGVTRGSITAPAPESLAPAEPKDDDRRPAARPSRRAGGEPKSAGGEPELRRRKR